MSALPDPGSVNPADGSSLEPVPSSTPEDLARVVAEARAAQPAWAARSLEERAQAIRRLAQAILDHSEEAVAIMVAETGRDAADCRLPEVGVVAPYADGAVRAAKKALARERLKISPIDMPGKKAWIDMVPRGVVGIIAPWNYPLMQFYKPLFPALLAGNAVVLKPSEHTPRTGAFLARICAQVLPKGLVGLVQGGGDVGAALLDADIDALTFTGSVATGKKVAVAAAERLIPCSVELGGKDAAVVLADCHFERTVAGITYCAMHNAGQDCASVERVYVEEPLADRFVEALGRVVGKLRVAPAPHAEVGPLQNAAQLAIVESHVKDALDRGATLVTGGEPTGSGYGYRPTVLDGCDESMKIVTDETFGPVAAIVRVKDAEEAIRRANDSRYGLNGSVWTSDLARGERLAKRLAVGVAHVNGHAWTGATLAEAPWTGVKDTGPGIAASRHAYHTFARPRVLVIDKSTQHEAYWFPADEDLDAFTRAVVEKGKGSLTSLFTLVKLLGRRVKTIKDFVGS